MHNWFTCKVTYEKVMGNGMQKQVTEPYLVDALSYTEAEARITEEMQPCIAGEFKIADIKRARYAELFFNETGGRYYEIKAGFITPDEKSGVEKVTPVRMLAEAAELEEAIAVFREGMKGTMADYCLMEVKETQIMDIFIHAGK